MSPEHGEAVRKATAALRNGSNATTGGLSGNVTGLYGAHSNITNGDMEEPESVAQAVAIFYCVLVRRHLRTCDSNDALHAARIRCSMSKKSSAP